MGVSYGTKLVSLETTLVKISDILNAIGIMVLAFRGHNPVLEIQVNNIMIYGIYTYASWLKKNTGYIF